jgi:hypothetical protein
MMELFSILAMEPSDKFQLPHLIEKKPPGQENTVGMIPILLGGSALALRTQNSDGIEYRLVFIGSN